MNYIQQLTSFYDWLELHPLSPSAINLWYGLLHMNHKAGWREKFSVPESVLCIKTGLTDRTLRKVRKELQDKGRIVVISQKGKAPIYRVIPFQTNHQELNPSQENEEEISFSTRSENISAHRSEGSTEDCTVHSSVSSSEVRSALINRKIDKQTEKQTPIQEPQLRQTWRNVFGSDIQTHQVQKISVFMNEDQMTESLILEALERVKKVAKPLGYFWTILINWAKLGIRTIKDLIIYEKQRYASQKQYPPKPDGGRAIPDKIDMNLEEGEGW